jgi:hypothetical protein
MIMMPKKYKKERAREKEMQVKLVNVFVNSSLLTKRHKCDMKLKLEERNVGGRF